MKKKSAIIVAIILMSIGFASVSTTLIINGNATISEGIDDFDIYFSKALIDNKDVYKSVVSQDKKSITFTTSELKTLGQTSMLTYEVTNNSSNYDANVSVTCVPRDGTTVKYTNIKNEFEESTTKVLAKNSLNGTLTITLNSLPIDEVIEEYVCVLTFNAVERDTLGKEIPAFQKDDWSTIAANVKSGNTDKYNVGDTKKVTIASHTNDCSSYSGSGASYVCTSSVEPERKLIVRIANKSECTTETSGTACGFVVEFVDAIENHNYNKADATNQNGTNVGGWRDSELRTYINDTIYNSLPSELQNVITTTKVISGHGNSDSINFETQDKLYLLSSEEIYGDFAISTKTKYDTAVGASKQLDYYKSQGVTTSSYAGATKQYNGSNADWWLRSADSNSASIVLRVDYRGRWGSNFALSSHGVSPAFRIA